MSKVAVVYWSGTGNTEAMAEHLGNTLAAEGADVQVIPVEEFSADDADSYDTFAFGCSAWGSEELEATEFLPVYDEVEPKLSGKKVVLFGSYGHGDGEYQEDWKDRATEAGADVVATVAALGEPDSEAEEALEAAAKELLA